MAKFFVADGLLEQTHAVHKEGCVRMNDITCIYLGDFIDSYYAIYAAKRLLDINPNGCRDCTPECYKSPGELEAQFSEDVTPLYVPKKSPARADR